MTQRKNEILVIVYFLVGYLLLQGIMLGVGQVEYFNENIEAKFTFLGIITFILVGLTTFLIIKKVSQRLKNQRKEFVLSWKKYSVMVILFFLFIYVVEIVSFSLISYFDLYESSLVEEVNISIIVQILQIITLIVFTPIMEEIVFRKTLIPMVASKTNMMIAVIVVNSFFAVMHVIGLGIPFFFMYLSIGLLLSLAYKVSKNNIFVVIFIHALLNIASILL